MSGGDIKTQVIELLGRHPNGVTDEMLTSKFGMQSMKAAALPVLNQLIQSNRLKATSLKGGGLRFMLVEEELAKKLEGLTPETMMVYHEIEGGGTDGISTGDIKKRTNIQQNTLTKATKELERRMIIKRVKSIHQKTQKIWMLYDLQPSTHITGGPWYTDNEFDHEFVTEICNVVERYISDEWHSHESTPTSLQRAVKYVSTSGISQEVLSTEHIKQILGRLTFDSKIEEYQMSEGAAKRLVDEGPFYRPTMAASTVMEVIEVDRSVISPCMNYLSLWSDWAEVDERAAVDAMELPNPFNSSANTSSFEIKSEH